MKLYLGFFLCVFSVLPAGRPDTQVQAADLEISPVFSRIIINNDSVIFRSDGQSYNGVDLKKGITLGHRSNNIAIEILPEDLFDYQFFLSGFDREYSSWQDRGFKEYTNLPGGNYTFETRYRSSTGKVSQMTPLKIRVMPVWYLSRLALIASLVLLSLLVWVFSESMNLKFARRQYMLEQIINKRTEDLIVEKEKTEALLNNVLPKITADELMAKGKATKTKYNFVTVLFSDIQGFTQIAEEMNPELLIDELDKFFFHFDSVAEKYRIEKIKTIGDAYMCAGGIPEKNRTNPVEVILAALEMQRYMARLKESSLKQGVKYWDIRIGIHTGTVVAGVVGHKKLSYDIWGDTVNTASRMESSGEAGKINISGTTYEFVKDFFICDYRGKMPVKYKGELDMYFVNGIRPGLTDGDDIPNRKFLLKLSMLRLEDVEDKLSGIFEEEAPPNLYFHNASFAASVTGQVDLLANAEEMTDEDYVDLKLASLFLCSGYISDYDNPLDAAVSLADEILPNYGFDENHSIIVRQIISNAFYEKYESLSDRILHDAHYAYLGREDYIKLTDKLFKERNEHGHFNDVASWIDSQKKMLLMHDFLTPSGRLLRSVTIDNQINKLEEYYGRSIL